MLVFRNVQMIEMSGIEMRRPVGMLLTTTRFDLSIIWRLSLFTHSHYHTVHQSHSFEEQSGSDAAFLSSEDVLSFKMASVTVSRFYSLCSINNLLCLPLNADLCCPRQLYSL
jgi:hypothetical protein